MGPDHVRADWHLRNWADWMRIPDIRTGYPTHWQGSPAAGSVGRMRLNTCATRPTTMPPTSPTGSSRDGCEDAGRNRKPLPAIRLAVPGDPEEVLAQAVQMFWLRALSKGCVEG